MNAEAPETYEERKSRREAERAAQARGGNPKRILLWILVLAAILLAAYGLYASVQSLLPKGPDYSTEFPIAGQGHIAEGAKGEGYNSNPPSSGPHYSSPAPTGFYKKELPDERILHNLEHGDVWIAYHPRVENAVRAQLLPFADHRKVIITPRAANDKDVALVAWGRVDSFDLEGGALPAERVEDFILRFRDKSPEKITQGKASEAQLE